MAHQAREQPGDPIHHRDAYAKVAAGGSMPGSGPNQRLRLAGSAWFFFPRAAQAMADMGEVTAPPIAEGRRHSPGRRPPTVRHSVRRPALTPDRRRGAQVMDALVLPTRCPSRLTG